jgi:superfamily II DNA or RNA helicase
MVDYEKKELSEAMDKPTITGDAVQHYIKLAAGKRAIAFCVSLDHAAHVADKFVAAGFRAERIDGQMERYQRRKSVDNFTRWAWHVQQARARKRGVGV